MSLSVTRRWRRAAGDGRPADPPAAAGPLAPLGSSTGVAVITASVFATMVGFLDASVVNVAVPAIGRDLGTSVSGLQWTLTGYLLTVAALLLLAGALADHFGRRRTLTVGLLVMLGASLLCAVAPSLGALTAARVLQGAGAAMVVPSSLSLLNGSLRPSDRARAIGIWAGLGTLGTTLGPYAGGWLVDHASWRWVFLLNLPLILAALIALRYVPEVRERRPLSLDITGVVLGAVGIGGVIYALTESSSSGWDNARVVVAGVIGVASLILFLPVERRSSAPMLRLSLFHSRQFDAINVTTVVYYGALSAAAYLLVLQCQLQLGFSASESGAALIPGSVVFVLLSPLSGALVARVGPRWLMVAGMVAMAAAFLSFSTAEAGSGYVDGVLPGALLWGLGLGLSVTPLTAAVLAAVGDADLGEAAAINDAASRVGAAIAIAVVPALIGATAGTSFTDALVDGYKPAMVALAVASILAALITAAFVSDDRAPAPLLAPQAPHHGCVPVREPQPAS
jgi:EmrB/QacA subfamily drug resistance transporter